jgi:predicted RNA-binding protein associated with RNAse of E/G family
VDVYIQKPWGLYMARPTPGRAQFHYLESWLLPALSIRATVFHWNPGHERVQDFYLDIADITAEADIWRTVDHYLDLVVLTGRRTELIDIDELLEAHKAGLIDETIAESALKAAVTAIDGLAQHRHDLHGWLGSNGMELSWR